MKKNTLRNLLPNSMSKILFFLLFFYSLLSCNNNNCVKNLKIHQNGNEIIISKAGKILSVEKNGDMFPPPNFTLRNSYIIDTPNCYLYLNDYNSFIKRINLKTGHVDDSIILVQPNMKYDDDFNLAIIDDVLFVKTNRHLITFSLNLSSKRSVLDSVFKLHPLLKSQIEGYWSYQIVNDTVYLDFKTRSSTTKTLISYPLN